MGCGKSVYAKQFSKALNMPAFDMDNIMEDLEGISIYDVFYNKGEDYFRELENKVLIDLVNTNKGYIIACGGGTPCFYNNMDLMQQSGITIYLKASETLLLNRLKSNRTSRPLIAMYDNVELKNFISSTLTERELFYNNADLVLEIDDANTPDLISTIRQTILEKQAQI